MYVFCYNEQALKISEQIQQAVSEIKCCDKTSTMTVNKLDPCQCNSMKRVKETFSKMNRSEFREDITGARKSIEKTWNESYKSNIDLL